MVSEHFKLLPLLSYSMARNSHTNASSGSGTINNNQPPKDPTQNSSSPYYVHPGDGPSSWQSHRFSLSVAVAQTYHSWARSMRRALGGKNKFEFVDGTIEVPDSFDPSFKAWSSCNMLIQSWIVNSVAEPIGQSIVFLENGMS